jgi:hypothetical protein
VVLLSVRQGDVARIRRAVEVTMLPEEEVERVLEQPVDDVERLIAAMSKRSVTRRRSTVLVVPAVLRAIESAVDAMPVYRSTADVDRLAAPGGLTEVWSGVLGKADVTNLLQEAGEEVAQDGDVPVADATLAVACITISVLMACVRDMVRRVDAERRLEARNVPQRHKHNVNISEAAKAKAKDDKAKSTTRPSPGRHASKRRKQ